MSQRNTKNITEKYKKRHTEIQKNVTEKYKKFHKEIPNKSQRNTRKIIEIC